VILYVCPHDKTKTAETKIAKLGTRPSRYLAQQWITGQKVKGQGHSITKCITVRQPCGTVSLRLCRRATRRSCTAVSSRDDTTNRAGLSYSRRWSSQHQLCTLSIVYYAGFTVRFNLKSLTHRYRVLWITATEPTICHNEYDYVMPNGTKYKLFICPTSNDTHCCGEEDRQNCCMPTPSSDE